MEIPQENKIRIDILFSMKVLFQRNICTSMQIAAIFTIVKVLKHQGLSTDERTYKTFHMMQYYPAIKK